MGIQGDYSFLPSVKEISRLNVRNETLCRRADIDVSGMRPCHQRHPDAGGHDYRVRRAVLNSGHAGRTFGLETSRGEGLISFTLIELVVTDYVLSRHQYWADLRCCPHPS